MHARDSLTPAISFALLDADGELVAARGEDETFYAASTIKLGVMLAVAQAVDAGRLSLDDRLDLPGSFASGIEGAPPYVLAPDDREDGYRAGTSATVVELVGRMIEVSSNEATNILAGTLGLDAVNEAFLACGARPTSMGRLIGDLAADGAGRTNATSAADLARVMRAIATGASTGGATTAMMRSTLARQQHPRIGTVIRPGVPWGSKSGDVPGISHDVAFVGEPESRDARFLAVCTAGYQEAHGHEAIASVAAALLSGQGAS